MDKVAEKTHAKLGPSGWDWWSNCPYAPTLSEGLPDPTSFYAAEGTVAHEISDRVLRGEAVDASQFLGKMFQCEGHDIVVDEEMVDGVTLYVDYVHSRVEDGGVLLCETQVPIGHLTGEEGATGTSDNIVINGSRMIVIDLKYGKGVRVNAEGNGQARMYALGALHQMGMVYDIDEVEVVIVHPRLEDGITTETLNIGELQEFADEVEIAAGRVLLATEEDLNPGEKQCKFCPAGKAMVCKAREAEISKSLALIAPADISDFADLTRPKQASALSITPEVPGEKIAAFLRAVPLIEAAITAARAEAERRLFAGQEIPGFYLGVGRKGHRKWTAEAEADVEATLRKKKIKVADIFQKKLISPTQAEKKLKGNPKAWEAVQDFIVRADGKPSVCREGDTNEVYIPVTAEDFADLTAMSEAERLLS